MMRVLLAGVLLAASLESAHAAPRCVEGPPPATPHKVNANNGLPALAAMVLAGGGGLGLLAMFSGVVGSLGAVELADGRQDMVPMLAVVAVFTTALLAASALTLLVGATLWFVAWLPPITDTRVRCPPRDDAAPSPVTESAMPPAQS